MAQRTTTPSNTGTLPQLSYTEAPLAARLDEITARLENVEKLLYDLDVLVPLDMAARLIPCTRDRMTNLLKRFRHQLKPRYMFDYKKHAKHRYLLGREIRFLRRQIYRGPGVVDL